ncbi:hypothetical protein B296_00023563 [Ensete ventricosum]|uniref:Uncharacterized protein n=1 Tax=Ensete ventricosum TaxID=4639 RepID=A0A426XQ30_ENSVE|nr:hypothetical protein B296_00023563 [Ensete ventricosum]
MQWELAESLSKVSGAYREFAESSSKVIGSLPGRYREFTRRRPRDSLEDYWGLRKAYREVWCSPQEDRQWTSVDLSEEDSESGRRTSYG